MQIGFGADGGNPSLRAGNVGNGCGWRGGVGGQVRFEIGLQEFVGNIEMAVPHLRPCGVDFVRVGHFCLLIKKGW